jgi:hypothetical protein
LPASHLALPRAMPIIPSVTMNGIMRRAAMVQPLMNPINPPASTVRE